jgi:hypothetical protein
VQAFDFAAGLRVVRLGVVELDALGDAFAFECDPAAAAVFAGDCTVVGQDPFWSAKFGYRFGEIGDDVAGFEQPSGGGGDHHRGVVIDHVRDLGFDSVGEWTVTDVGLPAFVRQLGYVTSVLWC